jgi:2-polyprenyl-6-hydroxyphenyl methylase/3-demethylubiquinone-9 3-methyltransferase
LRLEFIEKYCSLPHSPIIDIGCGGGILSESLAKAGAQVTGIDLSEEAIEAARAHANLQGLAINYQIASSEEFAKNFEGQYDVVTCMELLEHVPDPELLIISCARLLRPNGHLFLSTLNRNIKSYLFAIIGAEYLLKLLPTGTHRYERFIKPSELGDMVLAAGLQMSHMEGISYNPLHKTYRLVRDVSVNYVMHCYK